MVATVRTKRLSRNIHNWSVCVVSLSILCEHTRRSTSLVCSVIIITIIVGRLKNVDRSRCQKLVLCILFMVQNTLSCEKLRGGSAVVVQLKRRIAVVWSKNWCKELQRYINDLWYVMRVTTREGRHSLTLSGMVSISLDLDRM